MHTLTSFRFRSGLCLRDSLLLDFGTMLMSQKSFWMFGIDYLEQCNIEGNDAIELFLSKINIRNEKMALKILNVLRSKGLFEAGTWNNKNCATKAVIEALYFNINS